jgi:hypothetical protein
MPCLQTWVFAGLQWLLGDVEDERESRWEDYLGKDSPMIEALVDLLLVFGVIALVSEGFQILFGEVEIGD